MCVAYIHYIEKMKPTVLIGIVIIVIYILVREYFIEKASELLFRTLTVD